MMDIFVERAAAKVDDVAAGMGAVRRERGAAP